MSRPRSYFARDPNRPAPTAARMAEILARHVKIDGSGVAQSSRAPDVIQPEVPGANPVAAAIPSKINAEAEHRETSVREALSQPLGTSAPLSPVASIDPRLSLEPETGRVAGPVHELINCGVVKLGKHSSQLPVGALLASSPTTAGSNPAPVTIPSLEEQQDALRALTGAPPLPEYPQDPAPPLEAITQAPVMPQDYTPESPVLEWLEPMRHPNGEATQISSGGQYEVAGRRCPDGFTFIARHGLDILGTCRTAVDARARCLLHYIEQANG
jgi:hypothetical protein